MKPWSSSPQGKFYLLNATVVDARNSKLLDGPQFIEVQNGVINSVQPLNSFDRSKLDDNALAYDVSGKFISPGLIDAHVHVTAVPGVEVSFYCSFKLCRLQSDFIDHGRHGQTA